MKIKLFSIKRWRYPLIAVFISSFFLSGCSSDKPSHSPESEISNQPISKLIPTNPDGLKLLICGVDAAEWEIILPLLREGRLPNFARLMQEGSRGQLASLEPIFSPMVWTTIATGKLPEKHGITGFTITDPKTKRLVPISSNNRKTSALWNIYSLPNWTVGQVGWLASWPAETVHGFNCSIYTYPPFFKTDIDPIHDQNLQTTYPDTIRSDIGQYLISPDKLSDRIFQKEKLNALTHEYSKRYLFARDWAYRQIGLTLVDKYNPNVFAIYFDGVDLLCHANFPMYKWYRWIKYNEPTHIYVAPGSPQSSNYVDQPISSKTIPGYTPEFEQYLMTQGEALEYYYEFMDETLGELLKRTNDKTIIAVVSDHGFGENRGGTIKKTGDNYYARPTHWHKLFGVCILKGPGIKQNYFIKSVSVKDILPTLLYLTDFPVAKDMDGTIITEAIESDYQKKHPVKWIASYDPTCFLSRSTTSSIQSPYDKEILEQLRSLGYIQ